MSKAHTQTPWKEVGPHIFNEHGRIFVCTPDGVTHDEATANRALIVRAVNSHEAMVEALERYMAYCKPNSVEGDDAWHQARAALKLAKADQ